MALLYALHTDSQLDVQKILRELESVPELKHTVMSVAQKLIEEGKALGHVEGEAMGKWIGRLQVLEELSGLPVTPEEELRDLSPAELENRFRERQRHYESRFKGPARD